jgi:hypothetical protein
MPAIPDPTTAIRMAQREFGGSIPSSDEIEVDLELGMGTYL